jgi:hypothetical protein
MSYLFKDFKSLKNYFGGFKIGKERSKIKVLGGGLGEPRHYYSEI